MSEQATEPTTERRFDTTGPISLRVELFVGDVTMRATDEPATTVRLVPHGRGGEELAQRFTVEASGNDVVVLAPKARDTLFGFGMKGSVDVEVDLPAGSTVDVRTGSGDVRGTGLLGDVRVATGSGDIAVEDLSAGDFKSGSGDISARSARGGVRGKTGSGAIALESVGDRADLVSGSGSISVRRADAPVKAKTGSGDLHVGASSADLDLLTGTGDVELRGVHGGAVRVKTGTGDVTIGVATGVAAYLDLNTVTGDVGVDLEEASGPEGAEATASLSVQSGSGDIHVTRARASLS